MKPNTDYNFEIKYLGRDISVEVNGELLTTTSRGVLNDEQYVAFRNYLENEGFIVEKDKQKGIYDLF